MAETTGSGSRNMVSSVGAFLIAFLLGSGVMLIFHLYQIRRFDEELNKLRHEQELRQREAADSIAELSRKLVELQNKAGSK